MSLKSNSPEGSVPFPFGTPINPFRIFSPLTVKISSSSMASTIPSL